MTFDSRRKFSGNQIDMKSYIREENYFLTNPIALFLFGIPHNRQLQLQTNEYKYFHHILGSKPVLAICSLKDRIFMICSGGNRAN